MRKRWHHIARRHIGKNGDRQTRSTVKETAITLLKASTKQPLKEIHPDDNFDSQIRSNNTEKAISLAKPRLAFIDHRSTKEVSSKV